MKQSKQVFKVDDWVYDSRNAGVIGRVLRVSKSEIKVEFLNKHPVTTKSYKKLEQKYLKLD